MMNSTDASVMLKLPPSEDQSSLTGTAQPVGTLTSLERDAMFRLLHENYSGTTRQRFEADLDEKEWVVLIRERKNSTIRGFSTLMKIETKVEHATITAFFSGDTIISREYWGQPVLPRIWSRHVFRLAADMTGRKVFWFLICSGYKTYRFLPVFFKEFYPCYNRSTPADIRLLMDVLGSRKYPREYDAANGIVRFHEPTPLKEGIADITAQRLNDPHVAFFHKMNPGHVQGDELVCITEISPTNVTPAGRRMLGSRDPAR